jgi:phenylalanyl-tRNA synthetase alpha chain
VIGWLKKRGWADIVKKEKRTILEITPNGKTAGETEDERLLRFLRDNPGSEVKNKSIISLKSRKGVIEEKEVISLEVSLNEKGEEVLKKGIEIEEEITQLTSRIIKSGEWKKKKIRPYEINVFSPVLSRGKPHPLVEFKNQVRDIFLSMGFEEIEGEYVESCFWNMDALFIPQDHPAREMQDTLYCKWPEERKIDKKLLEIIKEIHESGGKTGSKGWRYRFSEKEAERVLLRTHTTVNTIRYLYEHPEPPARVFSIGKVFRRENLDATHLPEFYQIEGIVHEEGANFGQLIGILKEFYRRIGFEKIRLRPAYFPYTEPSMEVEVYWNGEWMELGGSGIFRPEVTLPAGIKNPVLAWGLGLERLALLKLGLSDIRKLYISDLRWLRDTSLL